MQRGQKKSETGIDHLERNDFIIQKQESKKKQLQEEAKKAVAEKEEVEAEVEAAKTEVADLWKEHDIADGRYDGRIQKYQQGLSR